LQKEREAGDLHADPTPLTGVDDATAITDAFLQLLAQVPVQIVRLDRQLVLTTCPYHQITLGGGLLLLHLGGWGVTRFAVKQIIICSDKQTNYKFQPLLLLFYATLGWGQRPGFIQETS
jgi:hypothetical protein